MNPNIILLTSLVFIIGFTRCNTSQFIKNLPGIHELLLMVFPSLSIIFLISSSHCLSPFWPQGVQSKQDPEMVSVSDIKAIQRILFLLH